MGALIGLEALLDEGTTLHCLMITVRGLQNVSSLGYVNMEKVLN